MIHLALAAALLAAPPPSAVCSIVSYDFQRQEDRDYFVAVPLPDTAAAGLGATRLGMFPEAPRPGQAPRRTVFGQVARVEQLGGRDTALVEAAFRTSGNREVVLVPWSFDAGCRPAVWSGPARWAELGSPGFYVARLREVPHWAGTRPTYDVFFAGRYPYPTGSHFRPVPAAERLTASEYFGLYAALPSNRTPYPQRIAAGRRLWSWARENAALATRQPAAQILDEVRRYFGWSPAEIERLMAPPAAAAPAQP